MTMTEPIKWPSREEWAKDRRTPYIDSAPDTADYSIEAYMTPAESASLKAAMRERWKELGRQMRQAGGKDVKNEQGYNDFQWRRKCISAGLKLIAQGTMPWLREHYHGAEDLVQELQARYEAARMAEIGKWEQEVAQTPIDDAAWDAELKRRAQVDAYLKPIDDLKRRLDQLERR
jgi:hypothetical protein